MSVAIATATAKLGKVATIGSHQPEAWRIIYCMVEEQGWHLPDIRYGRTSCWAKWTERFLRQQFGYRYHQVPELVDPASGLSKVSTWLDGGINFLLLCRCPNWLHCHRKYVATLLQHTYPTLGVAHLMPDSIEVELPVIFMKTVELFQRYGLLKSLPYAPGEHPVLVRTAKSQRITLPDFGPCTRNLSVTLWLADPRYQRGEGGRASRDHRRMKRARILTHPQTGRSSSQSSRRDDAQPPQQRSHEKTFYIPVLKESMVHARV